MLYKSIFPGKKRRKEECLEGGFKVADWSGRGLWLWKPWDRGYYGNCEPNKGILDYTSRYLPYLVAFVVPWIKCWDIIGMLASVTIEVLYRARQAGSDSPREEERYNVTAFNLLQCVKTISVCVLSHSNHVLPCATPWAIAQQAPLSAGFSQQEYWSGLPCSSPGIFSNQDSGPRLVCLLYLRQILYHWASGTPWGPFLDYVKITFEKRSDHLTHFLIYFHCWYLHPIWGLPN